eukprot:jgi/Bigna1/81814/fgenesh1_pg.84_\
MQRGIRIRQKSPKMPLTKMNSAAFDVHLCHCDKDLETSKSLSPCTLPKTHVLTHAFPRRVFFGTSSPPYYFSEYIGTDESKDDCFERIREVVLDGVGEKQRRKEAKRREAPASAPMKVQDDNKLTSSSTPITTGNRPSTTMIVSVVVVFLSTAVGLFLKMLMSS